MTKRDIRRRAHTKHSPVSSWVIRIVNHANAARCPLALEDQRKGDLPVDEERGTKPSLRILADSIDSGREEDDAPSGGNRRIDRPLDRRPIVFYSITLGAKHPDVHSPTLGGYPSSACLTHKKIEPLDRRDFAFHRFHRVAAQHQAVDVPRRREADRRRARWLELVVPGMVVRNLQIEEWPVRVLGLHIDRVPAGVLDLVVAAANAHAGANRMEVDPHAAGPVAIVGAVDVVAVDVDDPADAVDLILACHRRHDGGPRGVYQPSSGSWAHRASVCPRR